MPITRVPDQTSFIIFALWWSQIGEAGKVESLCSLRHSKSEGCLISSFCQTVDEGLENAMH